jgi:poly(A) polymerase
MISPNALKILYRLKDNGHIAYLVGGCVRDLLLGREPKDFDVATDATPGMIKKLFRNCRLVGRRFRLAHLHFRNEIIEVATFRASAADEEGRGEPREPSPEEAGNRRYPLRLVSEEGVVLRDNVFGTPAEDALRRDFTVNALAYNIADFSIIDYVGGVEDLKQGVIRTIGDPVVSFTEDPVRMLRAVRFAALLGFTVDESARRALVENAPAVTRASAPRLYEEVLKLFLSGEGEQVYQLMRRSGLFAPLFPGLGAWLDQESDGFPHVRLGRNLEWIDRRVGGGEAVSPALLFALMFGEFLEERAALMRGEGCAPQEAVNAAVAELLEEQSPLVAIPHRVGVIVRDILSLQNRLRRVPGKRPHGVLAHPGFGDALDYLRCRSEITGEDGKVLAWWERFAVENILPAATGKGERAETAKPRRRRRRRRSRAGGRERQVPSGETT